MRPSFPLFPPGLSTRAESTERIDFWKIVEVRLMPLYYHTHHNKTEEISENLAS